MLSIPSSGTTASTHRPRPVHQIGDGRGKAGATFDTEGLYPQGGAQATRRSHSPRWPTSAHSAAQVEWWMASAQIPWHFTTWLDLLDHWQSLAAGLVAVIAAVIAVGGAEFFGRLKECRERKAILLSLATEIRFLLQTMLDTHAVIATLAGKPIIVSALEVKEHTDLREPVIYPATADRIGILGPTLAQSVAGFYVNVQHIQFIGKITTGSMPGKPVHRNELVHIANIIEQACRAALPLLERLPADKRDVAFRTRIQEMT